MEKGKELGGDAKCICASGKLWGVVGHVGGREQGAREIEG